QPTAAASHKSLAQDHDGPIDVDCCRNSTPISRPCYVAVATVTPQRHSLGGTKNLFHRILKPQLAERPLLTTRRAFLFVLIRHHAQFSSPGPGCQPARGRTDP